MRESNLLKSQRRQKRKAEMMNRSRNIAFIIVSLLLIVSVTSDINKSLAIKELKQTIEIKDTEIKRLNAELDAAEIKIKQLDEANRIISMHVSRGAERSDSVDALKQYIERLTGKEVLRIEKRTFEATKYTEAEGGKSPDNPNYGKMYSGKMVYDGAVAAPHSVPIGSAIMLNIDGPEGQRIYTVEDRGGAIKDNGQTCIDIYSKSLKDAYKWGRQRNISGYVIVFKEN